MREGGRLGTSDGMSATGYLAKPRGDGPFPAMMIVYGARILQGRA